MEQNLQNFQNLLVGCGTAIALPLESRRLAGFPGNQKTVLRVLLVL